MEEKNRKRRFYNVEHYAKVYYQTILKAPPGKLRIIMNRGRRTLDAYQGVFTSLLGLPIIFGTVLAIVLGSRLGVVGVVGILAAILVSLGLIVERKMGSSLTFGDYNFWKRTLGTALAFIAALGLFFSMLFFSKVLG